MKPRKTLAQMSAESSSDEQPMQIAGKPADVCPHCGCALFKHGVNHTSHEIVRYANCRNPKCLKRFLTSQPPERIMREVGDDSAGGIPALTLVRESA